MPGALSSNHGEGAPRVCGDDPSAAPRSYAASIVLPAYAGMILSILATPKEIGECSPRMRG